MTEPREQCLDVDQLGKANLVENQILESQRPNTIQPELSRWLLALLTKAVSLKATRAKARARVKSEPRGVVWGFIDATANRGSRQV